MRKFFVFCLLLIVFSYSASAIFDVPYVGGKYVSLGMANVSEVNDVYAIVYNPSGLSGLKGISASISYSEPFGVFGMNLINANVGANIFDILSVGASYTRSGADLSSTSGLLEEIISLGVGKGFDLSEYIGFINTVSVGINGKLLNLSLSGYELDNSVNKTISSFSLDFGTTIVMLDKSISLGIVGYNLLPASFSFFGDTANSSLAYSALKFGASFYLVKPYMKVFGAYSLGLNSASSSSLSVGTEISYADTIFTRVGLIDNKLTMGIGLKAPNFEINFGVQNRDALGWYYQVDIIGFVDIFK
jgi:hypothetical protein